MTGRFDDDTLLEFVEGELDPTGMRRLEAQLAGESALMEQLRRLQADRLALQSLPDPEPEGDLVGDLEIALARPMLMDERPGAYRRRHRRPAWPRLVGRTLAAAAALALLVGGGWMVMQQLSARGHDAGAGDPRTPERLVREPNPVEAPVRTPADVLDGALAVVHEAPLVLEPMRTAMSVGPEVDSSAPRAVAPFAVALALPDREAEALLAALVESSPSTTTLVRNLTDREVRAVLDRAMAIARETGESPAWAQAGVDGPNAAARPHELRSAIGALRPESLGLDPRDLSGPLAGAEALEPSVPSQLAATRAGARLTLVLPLDRLESFVGEIQDAVAERCALRLLDDRADASWLEQLRRMRTWLDDARTRGTALVELPVLVGAGS